MSGEIGYTFEQFNFSQTMADGNVKSIPLQAQWETFFSLGGQLNSGINKDDIFEIFNFPATKEDFERSEPHYQLFFSCLGGKIDKEGIDIPLTNWCWYFDAEAIEDHGDYVRIIHDLARLTDGALTFTEVEDYVDIEDEVAWVALTINGDRYKWDLQVYDDWVDGQLFTEIVALTHKYNTIRKFTIDVCDQGGIIFYQTPEEMEALRQATGLNIEWLEGWSD